MPIQKEKSVIEETENFKNSNCLERLQKKFASITLFLFFVQCARSYKKTSQGYNVIFVSLLVTIDFKLHRIEA